MKEMFPVLAALARKAGAGIMDVRSKGFEVEYKDDNSPLTQADKASHEIIMAGLKESYPDMPILSEEGVDIPYKDRNGWNEFFLVDPLDGTKEFVKELGEFCVCIAFIKDRYPLLGAVYLPTRDTAYWGGKGLGAFRQVGQEEPQAIHTKPANEEGLVVVASRSHPDKRLDDFLADKKVKDMTPAGSALKFCLVAQGTANLYPRFNPTMEWDTGAGQAIVEGAGGAVTDMDGNRFIYNKESLRNNGFIVTS